MFKQFFDFLASLKLTIFCLSACLILVFAGTLAQMHLDAHTAQERYFQSLFVIWRATPDAFGVPVFPGGHLLGSVLLINLVAAQIRRFTWKLTKLGNHLTHSGIIVMLVGGLFTDLYSVSSHTTLAPGQTKDYSEDDLEMELAVVDQSAPAYDTVTSIPLSRLHPGAVISDKSLPFSLVVKRFYPNSILDGLEHAPQDATPASTSGAGASLTLTEAPVTTARNQVNQPGAVVEIVPSVAKNGTVAPSLGTWVVADMPNLPQSFTLDGKTWGISLRRTRYYKPYSITLGKFTHDLYPGTQMAKNYASTVKLNDPEKGVSREVMIYMNHPLRYRGDTYYQAGFQQGDAASILQVVHNPSFVAPYVGCAIVGLGLLIQFITSLVGFLRQRSAA